MIEEIISDLEPSIAKIILRKVEESGGELILSNGYLYLVLEKKPLKVLVVEERVLKEINENLDLPLRELKEKLLRLFYNKEVPAIIVEEPGKIVLP